MLQLQVARLLLLLQALNRIGWTPETLSDRNFPLTSLSSRSANVVIMYTFLLLSIYCTMNTFYQVE